jgi:hypothetical protein
MKELAKLKIQGTEITVSVLDLHNGKGLVKIESRHHSCTLLADRMVRDVREKYITTDNYTVLDTQTGHSILVKLSKTITKDIILVDAVYVPVHHNVFHEIPQTEPKPEEPVK